MKSVWRALRVRHSCSVPMGVTEETARMPRVTLPDAE